MGDQEAILTGHDGVFDAVLDAVRAWQHDAEFALGIGGFQDEALGGDLRADPDHQVLLATGGTESDPVALVGLVEDLDVLGLTERVPPDGVGTPGLVDRQVEDMRGVGGPGGTRRDVLDGVGEQFTGLEVLETQRVPLVALGVGGIRQQRAVEADRECPE